MTTPSPTHFLATIPRVGVLISFVIISNSDNEITTLPVRPAPPSSDRTLALYDYPLDSGDDLSNEDLRKEILTSPPSLLPSSYSPPSLLPSSSSLPPSLLPSSYVIKPDWLHHHYPIIYITITTTTTTTTITTISSSTTITKGCHSRDFSRDRPSKTSQDGKGSLLIEEIRDHQREITAASSESDVRIEIMEQELKTMRS
nr:hypothetical protein [Tanacetum cinerariifolium]